MSEKRLVISCSNCGEQYDEDEEDAVFILNGCGHVVCVSCSYDHIEDCCGFLSMASSSYNYLSEESDSY